MGKKKSKNQLNTGGVPNGVHNTKKEAALPPLGNKLGSASFTAINTLTKPALFHFMMTILPRMKVMFMTRLYCLTPLNWKWFRHPRLRDTKGHCMRK